MRRTLLVSLFLLCPLASVSGPVRAQWQPAKAPLLTRYAAHVQPANVLPEYPRPLLVRKEWRNLNGLWDLQVLAGDEKPPQRYTEKILVPFPFESALSGIGRRLKPTERLWYRRTFDVPRAWKDRRVLLHFGAVDWEAVVYLNGQEVGTHRGGYDPFTFDLTDHLKPEGEQTLVVAVRDATTDGKQPVGKQSLQPEGIWYTPTSGIWQTVWLEAVPRTYLRRIRIVPDIDGKCARIRVEVGGPAETTRVEAVALFEGQPVARAEGAASDELTLKVPQPKLWTPASPFLYRLRLTLTGGPGNRDEVESYFALRKISVGPDEKGITRILLNNQFVFQMGPLDQGFWPDGLYTAPTDEALLSDIEVMKRCGFNMVRKHVKVEPERWYYHCDRLGLLVWQDMPSLPPREPGPAARKQFDEELRRMVESLFNHPCIVVWVPFNEGWGQHDTEAVVERLRKLDPTRLINNASGWTDRKVGDLLDVHTYPAPKAPKPEAKRAAVIGEYGGLGYSVPEHLWTRRGWSYDDFRSEEDLTRAYESLCDTLHRQVRDPGLSAAVYTQLTDVESEINGLRTYDRQVFKIKPEDAAAAHAGRTPPVRVGETDLFVGEGKLELRCARAGAEIHYTVDGTLPTRTSPRYEGPIPVTGTTEVKSRAWWPDGASRIVTHTMRKATPRKPAEPAGKTYPGLLASYYELARPATRIPDLKGMRPTQVFANPIFDLRHAQRPDHFAMKFEGWLTVPETGVYLFYLSSDDGSRLLIGDEVVVDNDGVHGPRERVGAVALQAGRHPIAVHYLQYDRGRQLRVQYAGPGVSRRSIPGSALVCERPVPLTCLPPVLRNPSTLFLGSTRAVLACGYPEAEIRVTRDGSEPTKESPRYTEPLAIKDNVTLKARAFLDGMEPSPVRSFTFTRAVPEKAVAVQDARPGLSVAYYELDDVPPAMPDFAKLTPKRTFTQPRPDVTQIERPEKYGLLYRGYLSVPRTGVYTVALAADDEARLEIAGKTVIEKSHWTDAAKGLAPRVGSIALEAGTHPFELRYYQGIGGRGLDLHLLDALGRPQPLPEKSFTHAAPP